MLNKVLSDERLGAKVRVTENRCVIFNRSTYVYTPISKNVVGENGEWQLSNGNCTTERNCGFYIWYAKTMSSSGVAILDGNKNPTNLHI